MDSFFCQWGISSSMSHSLMLIFLLLVFCGQEGKARDLHSDRRIDERVSRGNCEEAHLQPTRGPGQPHIKRASSSVMYDAGYTALSTRVEMGPSRDLSQGRMKGRSRGVCQTKAHKGQMYRSDWALTRERFISPHFSWRHMGDILSSDEYEI